MGTSLGIDRLAGLFAYPTDGLQGEVEGALAFLAGLERPEDLEAPGRWAEALRPLIELLRDRPVEEVEECYTRTFDINPACSLEIGWHLFGEDYARGAFMVRTRDALRRAGVEESAELPDHFTHLLVLLAVLEREAETGETASRDEAIDLATRFVIPSMEKMLEGFTDGGNPWHPALVMIHDVLVERFGPGRGIEAAEATTVTPYACSSAGCPQTAFSAPQGPSQDPSRGQSGRDLPAEGVER